MDPFQPLFRALDAIVSLPTDEKERIRPLLRELHVNRGSYFVRAGERSDVIGFMQSGFLRYFYTDETGREFTRYFCRGGNFVSTANGAGTPSRYSVQAIEETELIVINYGDWISLLESHPVWAKITVEIHEHALRLAEERERSLILDGAARRYRALLDEFPEIERSVKQYDIASYLGITPVALSRIRGHRGVKKEATSLRSKLS